ncbi:Interstitial collagenase [Trachymyrmex cornetzi]|uniref:Interstitial collagenase n=1 Tax=Trachymyrmex cornetzi TaxID=471704 RepID=A0A151IXB9_9HYME|nr:Interstitial collagenase [Trachymyrmex cornetzi]
MATTTTNSPSSPQDINTEIILYLQKYGYLNNIGNNTQLSIGSEKLKQAIALFQEYYQIQGDGSLNDRTLHQMRKPRCGLSDIPHHEHDTGIHKWTKINLTWNFHLANANILKTTEFAFSLWAANSSLTFEREILNPDILISYRSGTHTYLDHKRNAEICPSSFDGRGGVLAHAFYPSRNPNYITEIHIDNAEAWHIYLHDKIPFNSERLLHTLTHEIGH